MVGELWRALETSGRGWRPLDRIGDLWTGFETYGQDLDNARQACRLLETFGQCRDKDGRDGVLWYELGQLWAWLENFGGI
jgi:hypothetical protein